MRQPDPFNRLESVTSHRTDWGYHDVNLSDYDDPGAFDDWLVAKKKREEEEAKQNH